MPRLALLTFIDVQEAFDADFSDGCITKDGWKNNATSNGRLGYKLVIQTGASDDPIDKSRVSAVANLPSLWF